MESIYTKSIGPPKATKQWPKLDKLAKRPKVSICTPTFNRRPFMTMTINCMLDQTYPHSLIEWIIVDDGHDQVRDVFAEHAALKATGITIKYVGRAELGLQDAVLEESTPATAPTDTTTTISNDAPPPPQNELTATKLTLGRKRNLMHDYATGQVIIYWDDDDYYPPERIQHAVKTLYDNPKAWIAGSSEMHCYFKHIGKMVKFGPYNQHGPPSPLKCTSHATAATFAFRRELLAHTRYDDNASVAEEAAFLHQYTVPMVQLDTKKSILVFSHNHNSFNKKNLLRGLTQQNNSTYTIDDYIKNPAIRQFFMTDIDDLLENYNPGKVNYKMDVIRNMLQMHSTRIDKHRNYVEKVSTQVNDHIQAVKFMNFLQQQQQTTTKK